jgi:hypothetical protein
MGVKRFAICNRKALLVDLEQLVNVFDGDAVKGDWNAFHLHL